MLTDAYEVLGGKAGTLTRFGAYNISFVVKVPENDDLLACTVVYAENENGFEKNADEIKMPASTTKIFTAAIGLEFLEDLDEEITILPEDINSLPDKFYGDDILPGDVMTIKELLCFMMLP